MADFVVRVRPNGPLVIEGAVKVVDQHGNAFPTNPAKPTVALCRCGQSANKPFCDGAHNRCGFLADQVAPAPRAGAGKLTVGCTKSTNVTVPHMRKAVVVLSAIALTTSAGCWSSDGPEVVVYTAHDAEFSKPIFAEFTKTTGIRVLPKFDTESTKTVGLAEAIIAEKANLRCDVFWNNELLHSLRLERLGLAETYRPRLAAEYPAEFRSPRGMWHGFAARARVLLVNTRLVPPDDRPTSIYDLADARWRGKTGIAKPLFGTTATHAACLFAALGDDEAKKFFARLKSTAQVMAGNRHVAQAVGGGQLAFGLTDTDDAMAEVEAGRPVTIVYPDQKPDQFGTLFIPNTLVIVANCPHKDEARRLVDYLLTPEVEGVLAAGPAAQIPLHPDCPVKARVETPKTMRAMQVDFVVAGEKWDAASRWLRDKFTSP